MRICLSISTLLLLGGALAHAKNMNSRPYVISNGDPSARTEYSTEYTVEFFDVYSPLISTLYSQVYWVAQDAVPLPPEIVERFQDKVIAITGYEVDQVMELEDGSEASVPITWAYNHHYMAFLKDQSKELIQEIQDNYKNHSYRWGINDDSDDPSTFKSQFFSEGNGGEFRSSYHGYPKGYAQLLHNPTHFIFNPMQIDTWNRTAMKDLEKPLYHPGPLPRSSRIPHSAGYSGLIECPCSDRQEKVWNMTYSVDATKCEGGDIENATECLDAAKNVFPSNEYHLVKNADEGDASGCSIVPHTEGAVDVHWNSKTTVTAMEDTSIVAFSNEQINMTVVLDKEQATIRMTGPPDRWFGAAFGATTMCLHQQSDACPQGGPYAIVVLGDSVEERKLDQHGPGHVLDASVQIVSNEIVDGNRTVVLTRPLQGLSDEHFTFDPTKASLDIIAARGCGMTFAQHCGHGSTTLSFLQTDTRTSICRSGIQGTIGGTAFNNDRCADQPTSDLKKQHNPTCTVQQYQGGLSCCHHLQSLLDKDQSVPWEDEKLEYRFKFRFYFQDYVPAAEDKKTAASHHHLTRVYWTTEAFAGEYDIPQCSDGTPPEQCVHTITSRFRVKDAVWGEMSGKAGLKLIYAGPHCHAPTCLSMELYNADTGELLCHVEPIHSSTGELYHETGFIAIPPCLWGSPEEGLVEPKFLPANTTLLSIKRNNSTLPHTGEMASWQMRAVLIPEEEKDIHAEVDKNEEEEVTAEKVEMKTFLRRAADPEQ